MRYLYLVRIVAVIQARMSSSRLPGKILEPLGQATVLAWVVSAARAATLVDDVVVATSTDPTDDVTSDVCAGLRVTCVRGSLSDLINRYRMALRYSEADAIVRLTADCPLLDPRLIDQCVAVWRADPRIFLATNALFRSYPRGLDVEVLSSAALDWLDGNSSGQQRTHVTTRLVEEPNDKYIVNLASAEDNSDLRVTVDTREDLEVVRRVVAEIGGQAQDHRRVIALLRERTDICALNSRIRQREWFQG